MSLIFEFVIVLWIEFFSAKYQGLLQPLFALRSRSFVTILNDKLEQYISKDVQTNTADTYNASSIDNRSNYILIGAVAIILFVLTILPYLVLPSALYMLFSALVLFYCFRAVDVPNANLHIDYFERYSGNIFYFVILGPFGALMYNYLVVARANVYTCVKLHAIASWLPARLVTFVYALTGKFNATIALWITMAFNMRVSSSELIVACSEVALEQESTEGLLARNTVIALAIILLIIKLLVTLLV